MNNEEKKLFQCNYGCSDWAVPSLVLDFKVIHPVSSARVPMTIIASRVNALGDRPTASEAEIWLVKVCVVVQVVSDATEDVIVYGTGVRVQFVTKATKIDACGSVTLTVEQQ